jgi:hypothetical protein
VSPAFGCGPSPSSAWVSNHFYPLRRLVIRNPVEQGHGTQSNPSCMKDLWPSASQFWKIIPDLETVNNPDPSMSPPKSSPRGNFSPFHGIAGLRANLPRLETPAGVPGSPLTVRREHQRSSHVAGRVTVVFSFSLPVLSFPLELGLVASAFVRPIRVGTTFYPF